MYLEFSEDGPQSVPVLILCGGRGTRLGEHSENRPKPMVEVGGIPIVRHVVDIYRKHGFRHFILLTGHMGREIRRYFAYDVPIERPSLTKSDSYTYLLDRPHVCVEVPPNEAWTASCIDTGQDTLTAGRILQGLRAIKQDVDNVAITYGDGVADIDLAEELEFHRFHGAVGTVASVLPPPRFGELTLSDDRVIDFAEKPAQRRAGRINGGFFLFRRQRLLEHLERIQKDYDESGMWDIHDTSFEGEPLQSLAHSGELMAYRHDGFWQCMDTPRDLALLNELAGSRSCPW